jgi:hypothetical protein
VDDPNHLNPEVAVECRALCEHLVDGDAEVYPTGIELLSLLGRSLPDEVPGRLYGIWGELTDRWELDPERRPEVEQLMRSASHDFLEISDYREQLGPYLARWWNALALAS